MPLIAAYAENWERPYIGHPPLAHGGDCIYFTLGLTTIPSILPKKDSHRTISQHSLDYIIQILMKRTTRTTRHSLKMYTAIFWTGYFSSFSSIVASHSFNFTFQNGKGSILFQKQLTMLMQNEWATHFWIQYFILDSWHTKHFRL